MQRQRLVDEFSTENTEECGSEQPLGVQLKTTWTKSIDLDYNTPVKDVI